MVRLLILGTGYLIAIVQHQKEKAKANILIVTSLIVTVVQIVIAPHDEFSFQSPALSPNEVSFVCVSWQTISDLRKVYKHTAWLPCDSAFVPNRHRSYACAASMGSCVQSTNAD